MTFDSLFLTAIQSSLLLGLIHGINPCGHSWLVLTPFVIGGKPGKMVSYLTLSFIAGTAVACLALGASLGAISLLIPPHLQWYIEVGTGVVLIILGLILIFRPYFLHHHDHGDSCHGKHCHHSHESHYDKAVKKKGKTTGLFLFGVGFVNMIIPCPTVAIMYGYAIESGNILKATLVFAAYALTTGVTVGVVIFAIIKISNLIRTLQQNWIETAMMRTAGFVTVLFSSITLYQL
ncbi:MAG: sulfite exporter TauE/SafE family protein [Desulfosarcina sp.]|nr:sulfite exporter TauE/SafE family protein [Desulfobacterales bacterium]